MTLPENHVQRIANAREALEGLSIADGFGGFFEASSVRSIPWQLQKRQLPPAPWHFTDDTNMALSVFQMLRVHGRIDQDQLIASFATHFDRTRGYGMGVRALVKRVKRGESWRDIAPAMFNGQGSYGNGGAMRVAPLGVYFADETESTIVEQTRLATEVTHAHPEGIAGAVAVALAAAVAFGLRGSETRLTRAEFIDRVLPHIPDSEVRKGVQRARDLPADTELRDAVAALGNGSHITAMDTVPYTLWCAGEKLDNFEEAIWMTAIGLGDVDTTCAIVGGIVTSYTGVQAIPKTWIECREPLPDWILTTA